MESGGSSWGEEPIVVDILVSLIFTANRRRVVEHLYIFTNRGSPSTNPCMSV